MVQYPDLDETQQTPGQTGAGPFQGQTGTSPFPGQTEAGSYPGQMGTSPFPGQPGMIQIAIHNVAQPGYPSRIIQCILYNIMYLLIHTKCSTTNQINQSVKKNND